MTQDNAEVEKKKRKKRGARSEELVKYMTNLPSYLHRLQSGVQALNIGVLDWGRLERWKEEQISLVLRRSPSRGSSSAPTILSLSSEEKLSRLDSSDSKEERAKMGTSLGKLPDHVLKPKQPPIAHGNQGKENQPYLLLMQCCMFLTKTAFHFSHSYLMPKVAFL